MLDRMMVDIWSIEWWRQCFEISVEPQHIIRLSKCIWFGNAVSLERHVREQVEQVREKRKREFGFDKYR